jgi:hypothetical protein
MRNPADTLFMNSLRKRSWSLARAPLFVVLMALALIARLEAANLTLWDTGSALGESFDLQKRTDWKPVPSDLFALEVDPGKASSDPGYYGRDYQFKGDAIVENASTLAVFWSAKGRVILYSRSGADKADFNQKTAEVFPLNQANGKITHCELVRNIGDEVVLNVSFHGAADAPAVFSFGKTEIVEIKPSEKMQGISVLAPIDYGIVPGFIGDDLIFGPSEASAPDTLSIPSENLFLGLLKGEGHALVMTWPKGKQEINLKLAPEKDGKRALQSVEFKNDGQSVFLTTLSAPGIWHREDLSASYLEKDVPIEWKRPFPAKWQTQLNEAGVKTTFAFRPAKGTVWRGVPGSYNYPVWFEGDNAFYHLSKKVPPKGESVVYFLEGNETPLSIATPVEIMRATLGRPMAESIFDTAGHKMRTHHRRGGTGVRRACTCGCTEAIQAVFEKGEEATRKDYIEEAIGDMIFFVQCHLERIDEYRRFADDTIKFLDEKEKESADLKAFIEEMRAIVERIPQEYNVQLENMKSLDYATELNRKTMALTASKGASNLSAYMDLLKAWRGMGGAQDYVVAQCHAITRKLFQEAGYNCATEPKALALAQEIRTRCRQTLRNPDGYEIWPNY